MRTLMALMATLALLAAPAWANGGGGMGGGGGSFASSEPLTPEQRALRDYNAGVKLVEAGDAAEAKAAQATDPAKRDKAATKAQAAYRKALAKFESATSEVPTISEAWNYIGYTRRTLGDAANALVAYDRALQLRPGYLDAIEYRGVAYLALNRLADSREAYLQLFGRDGALAGKLLDAMRLWIDERRAAPAGTDPAAVEDFARWVEERQRIAAGTAGLVPAATGHAWR